MAQTIVEMQKQLNDIAQKRLLIIEQGSAAAVQEIESMYSQLEDKIQKDNDTYNTEKLPKLLALLEQYDENSAAHKLYEDWKIVDHQGDTLIHLLAVAGKTDCLDDCLQHGVDINATNKAGETALDLAIKAQNYPT